MLLLWLGRSLLLQNGSMNEYMLIVFVLVIRSVIAYFVVCASTSLT